MSGKDRPNEGFDKKVDASSGQGTPESLSFANVMKGQGDRQQKAGDVAGAKAGVDALAYLNNPDVQQDLAESRNQLSPEYKQSFAAAIKVSNELREQGKKDPVEQSTQTSKEQQEQIDKYAKAAGKKPLDDQVDEARKLTQHMDKLVYHLNKAGVDSA